MSTTVSALESARAELPAFGDRLIGPDDPRYDEARTLFNAMIDKRPALIARCETADDVAAARTTAPASRASTTGSSSTCRR
jgi:hypothetical protein